MYALFKADAWALAAYLFSSLFFLPSASAQLGEANGGYFVDTVAYEIPAPQFSVGQNVPIYWFTNFHYYAFEITQTDVDPPKSAFFFTNSSYNPTITTDMNYNWTVSLDVADTTFSLHRNGSGYSGTFYMAIFNATNGPSKYGFISTVFNIVSNSSEPSSGATSSASLASSTAAASMPQSTLTSNFTSTTGTTTGVAPTAPPTATQTSPPIVTGFGNGRQADLRSGLGLAGFVVVAAVSWLWLCG